MKANKKKKIKQIIGKAVPEYKEILQKYKQKSKEDAPQTIYQCIKRLRNFSVEAAYLHCNYNYNKSTMTLTYENNKVDLRKTDNVQNFKSYFDKLHDKKHSNETAYAYMEIDLMILRNFYKDIYDKIVQLLSNSKLKYSEKNKIMKQCEAYYEDFQGRLTLFEDQLERDIMEITKDPEFMQGRIHKLIFDRHSNRPNLNEIVPYQIDCNNQNDVIELNDIDKGILGFLRGVDGLTRRPGENSIFLNDADLRKIFNEGCSYEVSLTRDKKSNEDIVQKFCEKGQRVNNVILPKIQNNRYLKEYKDISGNTRNDISDDTNKKVVIKKEDAKRKNNIKKPKDNNVITGIKKESGIKVTKNNKKRLKPIKELKQKDNKQILNIEEIKSIIKQSQQKQTNINSKYKVGKPKPGILKPIINKINIDRPNINKEVVVNPQKNNEFNNYKKNMSKLNLYDKKSKFNLYDKNSNLLKLKHNNIKEIP